MRISGKSRAFRRQWRMTTRAASDAGPPIVGIKEDAAPPLEANTMSTNLYGTLKKDKHAGNSAMPTAA
jgi:hypothetical protein